MTLIAAICAILICEPDSRFAHIYGVSILNDLYCDIRCFSQF